MHKTVIICGGSTGIGRSLIDNLLAREHLQLVVLSSHVSELTNVYASNEKIQLVSFDLTQDVSAQLTELKAHVGPIHALINNAGRLEKGSFRDLSLESFERSMHVNFFGPVALIQTLLPNLEAGNAHVVNISTMGAFQGSVKFPELTAYASSKAAITNFTEVFAEEFKATGMRMNCLCLGAVNTPMLRAAFPDYEAKVSADEMADFIAEFTLSSGRMMNGKIIPVSTSTP